MRRGLASASWLLSLLAGLALWEALARFGLLRAAFFPPPTKVAARLATMAATATLWPHLWATVWRTLLACLAASLPGVALGLSTDAR